MLCDVYVLKTLHFGTLALYAATFCNIMSCDVYIMLLFVMYQHLILMPVSQASMVPDLLGSDIRVK